MRGNLELRAIFKSLIIAIAAVLVAGGTAQAYVPPTGHTLGEYAADGITTVDMNVQLNEGTYYHEFDMDYTCGADGVIAFAGVGKQFDNQGEAISGSLDTVNRKLTYNATYNGTDFGWGVDATTATLVGTATSGDIDWSGTWNGYSLSGGFHNVPNCAPAPVAGNHGQYVSGATKCGVKGKALAAIAQDATKIGPYAAC